MPKKKIILAVCTATIIVFGAVMFIFSLERQTAEAMPAYVEATQAPMAAPIPNPTSTPIPEPTPNPVYLPESTHPGYSWVLPPVYSWISQFGDSFIRVARDGKTGVICAPTGEIIMPPKFQMIGDHEGFRDYMPAMLDNRWGVISADGEVVLPFEYVHLRVFVDYGVAMVMSDGRDYAGIVELHTGQKIVPFGLYNSISSPSYGLAEARRRDSSGTAQHRISSFIDVVTGEELLLLAHSHTMAFSNGLAAVSVDGLWGFINTSGEVVTPHIYDYIMGSFLDGTIAVSRDGLWGIIDITGAYILAPTHNQIYWPTDGFAAFSAIDPVSQNRYIGILSMQTGKEVVPAIYQGSFFAGEGIVLMRMDDFQNHDNNVLITLETGQQFAFPYATGDDIEYCGPMPPGFADGVSIVHIIDSEWRRMYGLADNQGREILPTIYYFIDRLPGGLFAVNAGPSQWGIMDRDGQIALPLIYCEIERILGGRDPGHDISAIRVCGEWVQSESNTSNPNWRLEGALWGFVDIRGQIMVPPVLEFLDVKTIGQSTAAVQMSDGLWGLIRIHTDGL